MANELTRTIMANLARQALGASERPTQTGAGCGHLSASEEGLLCQVIRGTAPHAAPRPQGSGTACSHRAGISLDELAKLAR